ncbi:MAG: glutamine synthetase type III [Planctomycetota bacterium]|nr:MAG: glutamine synthetase type III [Planctomycetota bacterium]
MSIENPRYHAVREIAAQRLPARTIEPDADPATDIFGKNVFSHAVMRSALPKDVYKSLMRTIHDGAPLDPQVADVVANAMKDWAIARGATHYCHWFLPLTGATAEKHDTFLVPTGDGQALVQFSGKTLIQGEPDASSFPSGGVRSTFEARGYTAWDATSPAFLMDGVNGKTLCIPTAFYSYDGTALDKKTPLLRSIAAVSAAAVRMLRLFGNTTVRSASCTVGPEQEYFLVDRRFYFLRPDLINAGRTLFGARPPKGQEMEDHYFGSIRERVLAFMMDSERTLYELGIPIKTRHNEVAPGQYEIAPVFENINIATDHNMLLMEVLKNTALKHGFKCLFHEKPFAGINGSGKHNNWSLCDDAGNNLLDPGSTPHENAQFLVFLTAVIRAVHTNAKVLRATIATAGNDHRLGANEAPPAIISIYLGDKLTEVVQGLISGKAEASSRHGGFLQLGVSSLPPLPRDDSDRNRTSPFAFTGNKFEFRAVGSSQSIAFPNTVLNTLVADALTGLADEIEKEKAAGATLEAAVQKVVQENLKKHQAILFNGDNYSAAWEQEAARRGLPNIKSSVDALASLGDPEVKAMFKRHGVYSETEADARYKILLEAYIKTINIEAQLTADMTRTMILPAALRYQGEVAGALAATKQAASNADGSAAEKVLKDVASLTSRLKGAVDKLDEIRGKADHAGHDLAGHAAFYRDQVKPAMNEVRQIADALELVVEDRYWPIPKYREMLFMI